MREGIKPMVKQVIDSAVNSLVENLEQGKGEALIAPLNWVSEPLPKDRRKRTINFLSKKS